MLIYRELHTQYSPVIESCTTSTYDALCLIEAEETEYCDSCGKEFRIGLLHKELILDTQCGDPVDFITICEKCL